MSQEIPHFKIRASVVHKLGEDLITDEVTALIELVKNAYDADATYASIEVNTVDFPIDEGLYFTKKNKFKTQPGFISVEDDGIGMGRTEIENGWLTISLSAKREMKSNGRVTLKKKRTPLGDKGLGRLSTQRLGQRLEMFTSRENLGELDRKQEDYSVQYHVAFDWGEFTDNLNLDAVPVYFGSRNPSRKGTKLVITNLKNPEIWKKENGNRLVNGLAQLLFPFGEVRPFKVFLKINGKREELDTLAGSTREAAHGRFYFKLEGAKLKISGRIRLAKLRGITKESREDYEKFLVPDQGADFFSYVTNPQNKQRISSLEYIGKNGWFLAFERTFEMRSLGLDIVGKSIAHPGNFHGEIDDFALRGIDLDPSEDVFSEVGDYNKFVKNQAGIRVFRDGFGIRPFGFDGDDWLGLSKGQTSGRSFYGLRPQNTLGYVALTAEVNGNLRETTSREGFIDSPYSRNFHTIMGKVIETINNELYSKIRRGFVAYRKEKAKSVTEIVQPDRPFKQMRLASENALKLQQQVEELEPAFTSIDKKIAEIVEHPLFFTSQERQITPLVEELRNTLAQGRELIKQVKTFIPQVEQLGIIADSLQPRIELLETQLSEFSELAGLDLTSEALSHEIQMITQRLAENTNRITRTLKQKQIIDSEIVSYTEYVHTAIAALTKQLSHLSPSLRYVREKKEVFDIELFLKEQMDFYEERMNRSKIEMHLKNAPYSFQVRMNKGKLTQIIDNLVLNSEYWLKQSLAQQEIEKAIITFTVKNPYLLVEDNGIGVEPAIELSLFQPFVTTKPRNQGRGLGLFIVNELLDSVGGNITLHQERNRLGRRYIFQIDLTGAINAS